MAYRLVRGVKSAAVSDRATGVRVEHQIGILP